MKFRDRAEWPGSIDGKAGRKGQGTGNGVPVEGKKSDEIICLRQQSRGAFDTFGPHGIGCKELVQQIVDRLGDKPGVLDPGATNGDSHDTCSVVVGPM